MGKHLQDKFEKDIKSAKLALRIIHYKDIYYHTKELFKRCSVLDVY